MTYQETVWQGRLVWITGLRSKNGKLHRYVANFVGQRGIVLQEAKNGMLLVRLYDRINAVSIPAGCLTKYPEAAWQLAGRKHGVTHET